MIKKELVRTQNEEGIKYKENSADSSVDIKKIIKVFEDNIHVISPFVYEKILSFTKQVSSKVIIMAINEAACYNVKTIKYIANILNSWISKDIKTENQVIAYQNQWASKKVNKTRKDTKSGGFCDYDQREYDFNLLEKQLLGYM